jgi:hypothetical protein
MLRGDGLSRAADRINTIARGTKRMMRRDSTPALTYALFYFAEPSLAHGGSFSMMIPRHTLCSIFA